MSAVLTDAAYGLVLIAGIALQVIRAVRGSLTLGRLIRRLLAARTARTVLFLGWAWLGWHLFVRGSAAFLH